MPPDRNLLFGVLALRMGFVSREALFAALRAAGRPVADVLRERGDLTADAAAAVERGVEAHLRTHGGNVAHTLTTLDATLGHPGGVPAVAPTAAGPRFRIVRPHAKGGLGEVFVAEDTELGRQVALKEIQPRHADDPGSRGRFVLEAEVTGGLEHPNIVPVYSLGAYPDGRPFYAMRFVAGDSLKEAIDRFHTQPWPVASAKNLAFRDLLTRFVDVCNAVAFAHSRGILHRDLKPANVMLGPFGETLLVDWGLAKPLGTAASDALLVPPSSGTGAVETQAGAAMGTPAYMSPEQAAGRPDELGPASDVYALGATLYTLLTGRPPFVGSAFDILPYVEAGTFARPREVRAEVPAALEAVVLKAMARLRDNRYSTAAALAAEVERWLADEPVQAFREPFRLRVRRWGRKHPGPVAGLAAAVLVGVAGLAAGLVAVNAEKNRTELARQGEAREAATATAVKDYVLKDLLGLAGAEAQADAQVAVSPDLKVRDLVTRAAKRLGGRFADQPVVAAQVRETLGLSLLQLGRPTEAIPLFEQARDLMVQQSGRDDPVALQCAANLAVALKAADRVPEALALFEDVWHRRQAALGPGHPRTLASAGNYAGALRHAGKAKESLALFQETLAHQRATLGGDHADTLLTANNVSTLLRENDRPEEALDVLADTLARLRATKGAGHPTTLLFMTNVAGALREVDRHAEALALYEEAHRLQTAALGADHPDTLAALLGVAAGLMDVDRIPEALDRLDEAVRRWQARAAGGAAPDRLALARTLVQQGQTRQRGTHWADAVASYERATAMFAALDRERALTDAFYQSLANTALVQAGKCRKAEAVVADLAFALRQPAKEVPDLLDLRTRALASSGDAAGVTATAAAFDRLAEGDAELAYDAASLWAVAFAAGEAGQREAAAAKVAAWLRRDHQHTPPAERAALVATIKRDRDFRPLRDHPAVRALLAELAGP